MTTFNHLKMENRGLCIVIWPVWQVEVILTGERFGLFHWLIKVSIREFYIPAFLNTF